MDSTVHRGSCLCGNVSYSVSGSPILSAYCHCTSCQRLNAAAFIHTLHFPASVFKWTHSEPHDGLLDSFSVPTRPWKTRWRCKNCGCTVASHNSKLDKWSVWGGQLERDAGGKIKGWDALQPTAHIFYETRILDVGDSLSKWTGYEGTSNKIGSLSTFQMTPTETMSKFRASPWVTYEPSTTSQSQSQNQPSDDEMDEDVDMDAPQISTLRDEDSPPPPAPPPPPQSPKKAASTRKTKSLTKVKKATDWAQIRNAERKSPGSEDEPEEPEEEEDQLIDDDDDDIPKPSPVPTPSSARSAADPAQKKKAAVKRKPRKSEKRPLEVEKKAREKIPQPSGAHLVAPTMSWFEANPTESHEGAGEPDAQVSLEGPLMIKLAVPGKKKTSPRKPPAIPRAKTKALKQKTAIPPLLIEDAGVVSEGYTGTAASSPVTAQFEANSPEPENSRPQSPQPHPAAAPLPEETNLEGVPLPQYPLPTKPFPVQPPPKMTSGFAPALPLDRTGTKVRRWRTANREIRGIAGGRWFTHAWVGEKESEYAAALLLKTGDEKSSGGLTLPKLSNISISAPPTGKAVSKLKASSSKTASLATSAAPSRSGSSIPDGVTSAVRAPTKMRILQVAPAASEAGDSDMAPPPDS